MVDIRDFTYHGKTRHFLVLQETADSIKGIQLDLVPEYEAQIIETVKDIPISEGTNEIPGWQKAWSKGWRHFKKVEMFPIKKEQETSGEE